jgi:nitrite reductase/ring-hydroxylating ferredoxin subunit
MRGMKIGTVKDLEFVPIMGVVVDGKEIVILKTGKKNLRSGTGAPTWDARCPVGTISGRIEGETIRCTCHGSVFNIKTGELVRGPAEKPEPVYTVSGENEELFIDV